MGVFDNDSDEISLDVLDIEEFASSQSGRKPKARAYRIRVDKAVLQVDKPEMLGREILVLANKVPVEAYRLKQKLHNGEMQTIELDTKVDFRGPGVERFVTLKLENTEG